MCVSSFRKTTLMRSPSCNIKEQTSPEGLPRMLFLDEAVMEGTIVCAFNYATVVEYSAFQRAKLT